MIKTTHYRSDWYAECVGYLGVCHFARCEEGEGGSLVGRQRFQGAGQSLGQFLLLQAAGRAGCGRRCGQLDPRVVGAAVQRDGEPNATGPDHVERPIGNDAQQQV